MSRHFALADLSPEHQRQAQEQMSAKAPAAIPTRQKYGNQRIELDGIEFSSKWEMQRYMELRNQVASGLITDLKLQQSFGLDAATASGPVRVGSYFADFTYWRDNRFVIEDAKSAATRRDKLYLWKRAHFEAQYAAKIIEIVKAKRTKKK